MKNDQNPEYWTIASRPNADSTLSRFNFYYSDKGDVLSLQGDGDAILFGRLGIGTSAPSKKIDVVGDNNFSGDLYKNNIIYKPNNVAINDLTDAKSDADGTQNGSSIFLGIDAGLNDDGSDNNNVGVGYQALRSNTTGTGNTANGYQSLYSNTTGHSNIAMGTRALFNNTTRSNLVAVGDSALYNNGVGAIYIINAIKNTAIGSKALYSNTTGYNNTANGYNALYSNTIGFNNTANGYQSLYHNTTGTKNTANGFQSLYSNSTGFENTANGNQSLYFNTTGEHNTANGHQALYYNTTGDDNTAIGIRSLTLNTTGGFNTAIGSYALNYNEAGSYNTALGFSAFTIGGAYSNSTGIGNDAEPGASNTVRIGNGAVSSIGGYANWTNVSDGRFKINVQENVVGLDFIAKLRPVTYQLDMDALATFNKTPDSLRLEESEKLKEAEVQTGFIAQEVEAAAQSIGFNFHGVDKPKNESSHYGLRYAEFVVPLVKAVQELNEQNEKYRSEIKALKAQISEMKAQVDLILRKMEKQ